MASSNSDFSLSVHTDGNELALEWARQRFAEYKRRAREVCSVEYTLLLNGRDDNNDLGEDAETELEHIDEATGEPLAYVERMRIAKLVETKLAALHEAQRVAAEHTAAEAAARSAEVARLARLKTEEHERAELVRLQSKYAGSLSDRPEQHEGSCIQNLVRYQED